MGRLKDKVCLITGGGSGIGRATAERFLQEGASVVITGRTKDKLEKTVAELNHPQVAYQVCDVRNSTEVESAFKKTVDLFGGLDVLFCNAGTEGTVSTIENGTEGDFRQVMEINVLGVWLCLHHGLPLLRQRGGGSVVVTASIAGLRGISGGATYSASKHAVIGLARSAAAEAGEFGVRVNCVSPGPIDNRMMASLQDQIAAQTPGLKSEMVRHGISERIPLKRYGRSEEVAELVLFLATENASFCNGGVYSVDGGMSGV